jgi:outer membrane protein OmpA-like peptidoglycan-associated protein
MQKLGVIMTKFVFVVSLINYSCSASEQMMKSVGIGCLAGLAAGALADAAKDKANNAKKKELQSQISGIFKKQKSKPEYKGKVVGLGVGCLAGLGVGYYLDQMAEDMDEQLKSAGMSIEKVEKDGETRELIVKAGEDSFNFKPNTSQLTDESAPKVEKLADALKGYAETKVRITGHVSNDKKTDFDVKLSQERADAVKDQLIKGGVSAGQISETKGLANEKPIAGTKPTDPKNRRVEIYILPES